MENDKELKQIDFVEIWKAAKKHWYLYPIWIVAAFAISCVIILPVPRYYTSTVKLAPELSSMINTGSLSSIAEQFGINISNNDMTNSDAIMPDLYPDVISSVDFLTSMFKVPVYVEKKNKKMSYYDYLSKCQSAAWWEKIIIKIKDTVTTDKDSKNKNDDSDKVNPFRLTKEQTEICSQLNKNIKCSVDKKNLVISITVEDQDPVISAVIADTVKNKLQKFITDYRTRKAKTDLNYALKIQADAKAQYEKSRRAYAEYADANQDVVLQSVSSKMEEMENEMQLRFNNYSAAGTQVQAARAKLREQTPAFTKLQSATVPIKPAGPKRMIFCAVWMLLAFVGVTIYSYAKK